MYDIIKLANSIGGFLVSLLLVWKGEIGWGVGITLLIIVFN